jgi:hypothetical protein
MTHPHPDKLGAGRNGGGPVNSATLLPPTPQSSPADITMPLTLPNAPCILIRRTAFEQAGLTRPEIDLRLMLTDEEFRVEGGLIIVGPLQTNEATGQLAELLEERGLTYFDDYFDLSGNWPEWLSLFGMATE